MTYECKTITKEQMEEMQTLWDNGHADAIAAYGIECIEAYKEGQSKGTRIGIAAGVAAVIVGIVTSVIVTKRKKHDHKYIKIRKVKQK